MVVEKEAFVIWVGRWILILPLVTSVSPRTVRHSI